MIENVADVMAQVRSAIGSGAVKVQQWANSVPAPPFVSSTQVAPAVPPRVTHPVTPPPIIPRVPSPGTPPHIASSGVPPLISSNPGPADAYPAAAAAQPARVVSFNGAALTEDQVRMLEQMSGKHLAQGAYWYDKASGLWGNHGGRPRGRIQPGLELGEPLRPDASGGATGVFINGRCLGWWELLRIRGFTSFPAGRYWLDPVDNFGVEGQPTPMGNLTMLAAQANRAVMYSIAASAIANMASGSNQGGQSAFGHGKNFTTRDLCGCNVVGPNSSE